MTKEKKSKNKFKVGTKVGWKWLGRLISGTVTEVHFESLSKTIKGKLIKRNGTAENPAYVVQAESGNFALKLHSELMPTEKSKSKSATPAMFSAK